MNFTSKERTLIDFLLVFYKNKIQLFSDIINQKTPLSLRLTDWLVTNYSKKYNIIYTVSRNGEIKHFNIYLDYKNQLKAYSKKFFDPFCRQKRIYINANNFTWSENYFENSVVTTVGQLNFFKWFIQNNIIEYAVKNIKLIDNDMNITMSNKNKNQRTVLSPAAVKGIYTTRENITIKFKT